MVHAGSVRGTESELWGSNRAPPKARACTPGAGLRGRARRMCPPLPTLALAAALVSCPLPLLSRDSATRQRVPSERRPPHTGGTQSGVQSHPPGTGLGSRAKAGKGSTGRGLGGRKSRQDGQRSQTKPMTKTHVFTVRPRPGCRPGTPLPLTPVGLLLTGTASTEVTSNGSRSVTPAMVGGNPESGWGAGDSCSAPRTQLLAVPAWGGVEGATGGAQTQALAGHPCSGSISAVNAWGWGSCNGHAGKPGWGSQRGKVLGPGWDPTARAPRRRWPWGRSGGPRQGRTRAPSASGRSPGAPAAWPRCAGTLGTGRVSPRGPTRC